MSWIKYENIKDLLHPSSYQDVKQWLKREQASLSNKDLDDIALQSILESQDPKQIPDYNKALKLFNIKLKQHIQNQKE